MSDPNPPIDRTNNAPPLSQRLHLLEGDSTPRGDETSPWVEANPSELPTDLPQKIDRFEIRQVLGKGAFGIVYRAYDGKLARDVAIKVPRTTNMSPGEVEEFLHDARAAAAIHHQNVCPVHEIGMESGQPFIVLHLVVGPTLAQVLADRKTPFPPRHAAAILRKLALGVAAAHAHGVTHRDLKPANVLVNSAAWDVLVTDFGLALLTDESRATSPGFAKGTPAYMAPEQARGDGAAIGPHSDIYALGVILYHLLTGTAPFRGEVTAVLYQAVHEAPEPPSARQSGIDSAIEEICLKAMAKKPEDRFLSAKAMANALGDYLKGRPAESGATLAPTGETKPVVTDSSRAEESWQQFLRIQHDPFPVPAAPVIVPVPQASKPLATGKVHRRIWLFGACIAFLLCLAITIAIGYSGRKPSGDGVDASRTLKASSAQTSAFFGTPSSPSSPLPAELGPSEPKPKKQSKRALVGEMTGEWRIEGDQLVQTSAAGGIVLFGDPSWSDFDFSADLQAIGNSTCQLVYHAESRREFSAALVYGPVFSDGNRRLSLQSFDPSGKTGNRKGFTKNDRMILPAVVNPQYWHTILISVRGEQTTVTINGIDKHTFTSQGDANGMVGCRTYEGRGRYMHLRVTAPDGAVLWEGLPELP